MIYGDEKKMEWHFVKFFYGLPWFMHWADNEASTQPSSYDHHSINVYFAKKKWSPYSIRGLSTIVHECFHVLQYRTLLHGWGIGYFRLFLIPYFSGYALRGRSRLHLIEGPAYEEEDKFRECLARTLAELNITDAEESFFRRSDEILAHFKGKCPDIRPEFYKLNFWKLMSQMSPASGWWRGNKTAEMIATPWILIWTLFAGSVSLVFAILKPVLEILLLLPYLCMILLVMIIRLAGK